MAEEFMSLGEVLRRTKWTKESLQRRLRRRGITIYVNPDDKRARLIRRVDAEHLRTPRPVQSASSAHTS